MYCDPEDHVWVRVVAGKTYDKDFVTNVCVNCRCHSAVRKPDAVTLYLSLLEETNPSPEVQTVINQIRDGL